MSLEFARNVLTENLFERQLNMSRKIVVFNIKQFVKTENHITGHKFIYLNENFEIINREGSNLLIIG